MVENFINRRQVLKTVGGTVTSGVGTASVIGEASADTLRHFVGHSYDTRTHVHQAEATSNVKSDGRKLRGNLKIGGFSLPLNGVHPVAGDSKMPEYRKRFSNPGMLEDGLPLDLRVRTTGNTLVGSLSRPDPAYAELSFTMDAVDMGGRADAVRAGLDESMAARFETVPSIKNKGVPTSTSIVNLKRGENDG